MRGMISLDDLRAGDDPLLLWAAQDMRPGVRAWALGDAAAVACPDVSARDRLALRGSPADVTALVQRLRPQVAGFHPVGDEDLIAAIPGLVLEARFGWMDTTTPAGVARAHEPRWLHDDEEVAAFLAVHHPGSFARPGDTGVARWAGIRGRDGELLCVGADAWSPGTAVAATSMTAAGATSLSGTICETSSPSRAVTQCTGASRWVPVCSPVWMLFQYQAGPRSS